MKVTVFQNVTTTTTPHYRDISDIYTAIKDGTYSELVAKIRAIDKKDKRDVLKRKLASICFSGIFTHRKNEAILEHSGLVCIDFDHVSDYDSFWNRIISDPYTHMAFKSPSGDGVKVIIKIPPSIETHKLSCRALRDYYKSDNLDEFEDVARVCYISHDPDIYWNRGSVIFTDLVKEKTTNQPQKITIQETIGDPDEIYRNIKTWLEKRDSYVDGNKHKFLVKLSYACCRFGLSSNMACTRIVVDYKNAATPVNVRDIEKLVADVYKNAGHNYGTASFSRDVIIETSSGKDISSDVVNKELWMNDIITVDDIKDTMIDSFRNGKRRGETTYLPAIDQHWTWKRGEVTLMGGIMNHGKTSMFMHLCLIKSVKEGVKWGVFSREQNPPVDFYDEIIQMYMGKPTEKRFENRMNESEYRVGMDFVKEHFYYVYPKNEKPSQEYINRLFSELIAKYGISGCIIDPFNQLDHHLRMSSRDDLYISDFLTEEKKFAIDNDVYKVIIAHPNKMQKNESGNYTCPDVFDFNGGSIWGAKVDNVLQTYRPNYSTDPSNTEVHFISQKIKKQKLIGIPGTVTLHYNRDSGRYFDCYGYNPLDNIHKSTQTDMKLQTEDPFSNLHPNDDSNPF